MSEKRYRDLIPNQDVIRESDEVDFEINDKWAPIPAHFIGQFAEEGDVPFRRPITEPTDKDSLTVENGGEVGTPDDELRRWQDGIRDAILKRYPSANIDGAGCDSGDPLDFTLAEINQGFQHVEKERDEWRELAGKLASSCFQTYAVLSNSMVLCRVCGTRADSSENEHPHHRGCPIIEIDAALAAYELKAKEGK